MFSKIKNALLYLWDRLFPPIREENDDVDYLITGQYVITELIDKQDSTPREEL